MSVNRMGDHVLIHMVESKYVSSAFVRCDRVATQREGRVLDECGAAGAKWLAFQSVDSVNHDPIAIGADHWFVLIFELAMVDHSRAGAIRPNPSEAGVREERIVDAKIDGPLEQDAHLTPVRA